MSSKISNAFSTENGILLFFPNTDKALYTYYDDKSNIMFKLLNSENCSNELISANNSLIIRIFLCIIAITISIYFNKIFCGFFFVLTISRHLSAFIEIAIFNSKRKRFHGAEHKIINCYNKGRCLPTLDEIRKSSILHKDCGSQKEFNLLISRLIVLVLLVFGKKYILYCFIIYIFLPIILNFLKLTLFAQLLVVKVPTDYELELASVAIKKYDEMQKYL